MPLTREPRNKDIYTDEVDQKGGYVAKVRDAQARKSIEQLQAEVDELASRPPSVVIDDTTPSYGSVYSSQKVEDELAGLKTELSGDIDDVADAAEAAQTTADSKPDIDDTTPSSSSVYSSEQTEERIADEIEAAAADLVSFTEDQTSRTAAEKFQARDNIGAIADLPDPS